MLGTITNCCYNWAFSECDPAACPPMSAPSCRDDQFLVEVRGEKPCCYTYLCGESFHNDLLPSRLPPLTSSWLIPKNGIFLAHVSCLRSVWVMYWTCSNVFTRRNLGCGFQQHLQLLSSLLLWWVCPLREHVRFCDTVFKVMLVLSLMRCYSLWRQPVPWIICYLHTWSLSGAGHRCWELLPTIPLWYKIIHTHS